MCGCSVRTLAVLSIVTALGLSAFYRFLPMTSHPALFVLRNGAQSIPALNYYGRHFEREDIPDLSGKLVIVTGGNSGVGYESAREMFRKGADVVIGCRSLDRGKAAVAKMDQELK